MTIGESNTQAILSVTHHMTTCNYSTPAFTGFAAGVTVNYTGRKFATCTAGAPGAPCLANISENF
jgi:hypothetical protein